MFILSQIIGLLAIICWVMSIQQKNKEKILMNQMFANTLYTIQYVLLGAYSASAMNITSAIRSLVFYNDEKKHKQSKLTGSILIAAIIIIGIITYSSPISIIPILITIAYTYSVWQSNLKITRIIFIIAAIIWIYYNLKVGAYISIIGNSLEIISGIISIKRFHKKHKSIINKKGEEWYRWTIKQTNKFTYLILFVYL